MDFVFRRWLKREGAGMPVAPVTRCCLTKTQQQNTPLPTPSQKKQKKRYLAALLLSLGAMLHLELPHVNVLSKVDLLRSYGPLGELAFF
jgi:hypothetical protein